MRHNAGGLLLDLHDAIGELLKCHKNTSVSCALSQLLLDPLVVGGDEVIESRDGYVGHPRVVEEVACVARAGPSLGQYNHLETNSV